MKNAIYIQIKFLVIIAFLSILACQNQPGVSTHTTPALNSEDSEKSSPKIVGKIPTKYTDTLKIDCPAAVFYRPDTQQVLDFKAHNTINVYESMQHDCFFQQRNSRIVLKHDWPKIKIMDTGKARFLKFILSKQKETIIDLDKKGDLCGILLFKPGKEPELIDMMNVETALDYYFNDK